jgi:DNA-binding PadR family transcriptional regulator
MNTATTNQTIEFAQTIREAHIQILKALETLQKNAFFTTDWIDNNSVLYSLSFEIEKNLEDVLFNDLFKVVDVLKEKGLDYEPIDSIEYESNNSIKKSDIIARQQTEHWVEDSIIEQGDIITQEQAERWLAQKGLND